jgi:hypothetical protein
MVATIHELFYKVGRAVESRWPRGAKVFWFFFSKKNRFLPASNLIPKIPHPPAQPPLNFSRGFGVQQPPPAAHLAGAVGVVAVPLAVQIHHVSGFTPAGSENM